MALDPQFPAVVRTAHTKLVNATGTSAQTLLTMGGTIGGILITLFLTSNDTTAHNLTLLLGDGTEDVLLDTVTIPAAVTATPVQRVNLMNAYRWAELDPNNVQGFLASGRILKVRMETAVSSGASEVAVISSYGEY